jgi:mannose-6-phosphate isomerase-like protein (cupin superfamily)
VDVAERIDNPGICVARLGQGELISEVLCGLLNPVDPTSFHVFKLAAGTDVELHYHDYDEYWSFIAGHPQVTLRTPAGVTGQFDLGPGDMVACLRGIEHTLWADHELVYYQYSSIRTGGERTGHLVRTNEY